MAFKKKVEDKVEEVPVTPEPTPVQTQQPVPILPKVKPGLWIMQEVQSQASLFYNEKTGEYLEDREVLLKILNTLEEFKE